MSKAIERRMTLKDQVTPTMSKINKSTLSYKKNVRDLKNEGQKTWSSLKYGMAGVVAAGAALLGSVMAINGMEEAYKKQIQAEVKLEAIMKSTGKATAAQIQGLKEYASTMQSVGVVGDEVALSGMQQLATFNVTSSTIETLTGSMLDLVAQQKGVNASQEDMISIGNMVGKAMDGNYGALSRVGISFTEAQAKVLKFGTEEERAATLAAVLQQNVGGVNAALAQTDVGRIQQANNAISDLQEVAGQAVVNIKAGFASAFMDNLPEIQSGIQEIANGINSWVDGGGIDRFVSGVTTAVNVVKFLSPVILGVAAALATYKIIAMAATVQQWALNVAMNANPVGVIIMAVFALIGVIIMLKKNWEQVKLVFMVVWNAIATAGETSINKMIGGLNSFLNAAAYIGDSIKYIFASMWNKVVEGTENAISKLVTPLNAVLEAVGKDAIKVNFSAMKSTMEKPTLGKKEYIKEIEVKKFSEDSIMNQVEKARSEKQTNEAKKREENTQALMNAIVDNTNAVGENTSAVKKSSSDLTGEEIADRLLPRLERVIYG